MIRAVHLYFGVMSCVYKEMRERRSLLWDTEFGLRTGHEWPRTARHF